jgi:hypothetical protein
MNDPKKPFFDLTEEASKRSDEEATSIARQLESSDDINAETNSGIVNGPNDDAENRVWTSSSDE